MPGAWREPNARIGRKNKIARRRARRGTRPTAPKDQRTKSVYIFGAICPELNPGENIRQFMRDNRLSNRIFTSHDNIVDHCCEAWNKLVDQPWRIITIGRRKWTRGI